jgi:hypothetical protein
VVTHDSLASGEPDAAAFIFRRRVEPLERLEDAIVVFRIDANPVVTH